MSFCSNSSPPGGPKEHYTLISPKWEVNKIICKNIIHNIKNILSMNYNLEGATEDLQQSAFLKEQQKE